jgi:hypothetical protein
MATWRSGSRSKPGHAPITLKRRLDPQITGFHGLEAGWERLSFHPAGEMETAMRWGFLFQSIRGIREIGG